MNGFLEWTIWGLPIAWVVPGLPIAWAVWWLWWNLPKREVAKLRHSIRNPKDRIDVEDTLRKTIGQAIAAVAVLIGAGFAVAQFLEQRDVAQKQIQSSHDLLVSNQISKGFEQLGSDKVAVRLGGIYALEGILHMEPPDEDTSTPDYRRPSLEALCAFVREHTTRIVVQAGPTTDTEAALTVILRRPKWIRGSVNLAHVILPGVDLLKADLSDANLSGANLSGANMDEADLHFADLRGSNLSGAKLRGAIIFDLADANLTHADLRGADLFRGISSRANLSGANLSEANLRQLLLDGADLTGADLTDTDLDGAVLDDAHLDNQDQLSKACGKPRVLPKGFTLNRPCPPNPRTSRRRDAQ